MTLKLTNSQILDGYHAQASSAYRDRIPLTTQASIEATVKTLFTYPALRNEFITSLVNKVGLTIFNTVQWNNPLAIFKRGALDFGSTIEEITMGLIKSTTYSHDDDSLERELFGRAPADVVVNYHTVNRESKYKVTVEAVTLRRAFTSEYGLQTLMSEMVGAANTSDQWDEFILMTGLFSLVESSSGFHKINVADVGDFGSDGADSKYFLRRIRETADNMSFISTHYNSLHMPVAANREDLVLFITPEANAAADVEALAGLFHVEKADVPGRTVVIPQEHMRIPGAQAILTTPNFFMVADTYLDTTEMDNAAGLYRNYWLHHHQVMSASLAAPVVLFTTDASTPIILNDEPEVTAVDVSSMVDRAGNTVTAAKRGELYQIISSTTITPDDGRGNPVTYRVLGASSAMTLITQLGVLHVGIDEIAQTLTIEGTSSDFDSAVTDTMVITVYGDRVIYMPPEVVEDADSDGIGEVTPTELVAQDTNKVTIPDDVAGVQYRKQVTTGVTFTDAGDIVTLPSGNGLSVDDRIVFGTITSTTGVTAGTEYFVKTKPNATTLTLSATKGGAVVALTTNGSAASATFDVAAGSTHTAISGQVFSAIADPSSQYELAPGATSSWTPVA